MGKLETNTTETTQSEIFFFCQQQTLEIHTTSQCAIKFNDNTNFASTHQTYRYYTLNNIRIDVRKKKKLYAAIEFNDQQC